MIDGSRTIAPRKTGPNPKPNSNAYPNPNAYPNLESNQGAILLRAQLYKMRTSRNGTKMFDQKWRSAKTKYLESK